MSELKITGTIKVIGEKQVFDSGFEKVTFVITTDETYPQDVSFDAIKDNADALIQYNKVGDKVEVKFNVRGNFFKERYYVNLQSWHVQKLDEAKPVEAQGIQADEESDLPF